MPSEFFLRYRAVLVQLTEAKRGVPYLLEISSPALPIAEWNFNTSLYFPAEWHLNAPNELFRVYLVYFELPAYGGRGQGQETVL